MEDLLERLTFDEMDLFWAQAWFIWNQRNCVVHGGKLKDLSSLNERAEQFVDDFKQAQNHLTIQTRQPLSGDVRQPPPQSEYKLNFDATVFWGLDRSGYRAII